MLGPAPDEGKGVLFALHGYGQLAPYFIRKFTAIAEAGWTVVVPEGGHRFYLKGSSGRVGASWMTREDRINDIDDLVAMLDGVYRDVFSGNLKKDAEKEKPVALLGFSQGVPAALRWAALGQFSFDRIIAHSGVFPSDLPPGAEPENGWPVVDMLIGNDDPYITSAATEQVKSSGISCERHTFEGGHDIDAEAVLGLLGKLA